MDAALLSVKASMKDLAPSEKAQLLTKLLDELGIKVWRPPLQGASLEESRVVATEFAVACGLVMQSAKAGGAGAGAGAGAGSREIHEIGIPTVFVDPTELAALVEANAAAAAENASKTKRKKNKRTPEAPPPPLRASWTPPVPISDAEFADIVKTSAQTINGTCKQKLALDPQQMRMCVKPSTITANRTNESSNGLLCCQLCFSLHQAKCYKDGKTCVKSNHLGVVIPFLLNYDIAPGQAWRDKYIQQAPGWEVAMVERFYTILLPVETPDGLCVDPTWAQAIHRRSIETRNSHWTLAVGTAQEMRERGILHRYGQVIRKRPSVLAQQAARLAAKKAAATAKLAGEENSAGAGAGVESTRSEEDDPDVRLAIESGQMEMGDPTYAGGGMLVPIEAPNNYLAIYGDMYGLPEGVAAPQKKKKKNRLASVDGGMPDGEEENKAPSPPTRNWMCPEEPEPALPEKKKTRFSPEEPLGGMSHEALEAVRNLQIFMDEGDLQL